MRQALFAGVMILCAVSAEGQPTFSREVSRITQKKCQICHRPNDVGPFVLATYEQAKERLEEIREAVATKMMPPWKAVDGHGEFKDNFGLTEEERRTILEWIDAGGPEGDPAELPEPLPETGEWELGEPDAVVKMPEVYQVSRAKDTYRCFVLPTGFDEDRWVSAVQVVPGDRRIVHHVILFLDSTGKSEELDAKEDGPGYTCFGGPGLDVGVSSPTAILDLLSGLGGWVPGTRARHLPEGVGLKLPKGARIVMQVHYHPHGHPGPDETKVGLYFSKKDVTERMLYVPVLNTTFRLQPGEVKDVRASLPVLLGAKLIQIVPHMHLLGRKIKVELTQIGRDPRPLIYIDDWDFNWQFFYSYAEPIRLPFLSSVRLTCTFDNTASNPRNPSDPPRAVGWGEGSEDEMCLAFLGVTLDGGGIPFFRSGQR